MKRLFLFFAAIAVFSMLGMTYAQAQKSSFTAEERSLILNPTGNIDWLEGISLANHEVIVNGKISIGERLYIFILARSSSQQIPGNPSAGFGGISYSYEKKFGAEAGIGISSRNNVLSDELIFSGRRIRSRGAVWFKIPFEAGFVSSMRFCAEGETGGRGYGEKYWWERKNDLWVRSKFVFNTGPIGFGALYESTAGIGGILEIKIPETPVTAYGGILFSGNMRIEDDIIVKKGTRMWAFGVSVTSITGD